MIGDNWSTRRLAAHTGIPNSTLQGLIDKLNLAGVTLTDWPFDRAIIAARAYRDGHTPQAIRLLHTQPYLPTTSWLISNANEAHIFPTLLQATAHIEQQPHPIYHLSPINLPAENAA